MRAAAKFDRIGLAGLRAFDGLAHRHDADFIAVFLAEQRHRAFGDRIVDAHQAGRDGCVLQDDDIGHLLDLSQLFRRHRLRMRDVETQALGRHQRALLGHVSAEHLAQRLVQQMCRRMVGTQARTASVIDSQGNRIADLQRAFRNGCHMDEHALTLLLGVGHTELGIVGRNEAGIAHLAAGFAVERRLVQHELDFLAGRGTIDGLAVADDRLHDAFGRLGVRSPGIRSRRTSP